MAYEVLIFTPIDIDIFYSLGYIPVNILLTGVRGVGQRDRAFHCLSFLPYGNKSFQSCNKKHSDGDQNGILEQKHEETLEGSRQTIRMLKPNGHQNQKNSNEYVCKGLNEEHEVGDLVALFLRE